MISRRQVLGAGPAGLTLAMLPGCGARDAGHVSWWGMGPQGENAPQLLPPFEQASGIDVDIQALPWTGAHEKLLTAYAGGSLPDVVMLNDFWVVELAMLGALASVPHDRRDLLAGQFPALLDMMRAGPDFVAVPWTVDSWIQFYRRDLLATIGHDAPPGDWAGWTRMAQDYKRRHPDTYVTLHLLDWPEPLSNFAAQTGEPMLRDGGTRGNFSSPGFRAALGFYKSIFDAGFSPAVTGVEAGDTILRFRRGGIAILPSPAEAIGQFRRLAPAFSTDLWGAAATPGPSGGEGVWAAGNCLAVSRTCKAPERAWALIDYLRGVPAQLRLHAVTGDLPSRRAAWSDPTFANVHVEGAIGQQIARAVPGIIVPESERIGTEMQRVAEHMVRGEYGVDAAAREMDRRVDAILAKRRYLLDRGLLDRRQGA